MGRRAADYVIDQSTFPFLSLEFVVAGRGRLTLAGREYPLATGSIFTYGPGVPHRIENEPDHCLTKYFVNFHGERARQLMDDLGLTPGTAIQVANPQRVHELLDQLIWSGSKHHRLADRTSALLVELLLMSIVMSHAEAKASAGARATFERCRDHIQQHFLAIRSLEDVTSACHVDVAYLCRLFRRFSRQTPFQFFQRLQMNWAAERLQTSPLLIRQIADELRIDPFQFSRTFRRIHGIPPSEFLYLRAKPPHGK